MNMEFLQKELLPKRAQEIKDGKNSATSQPIYVVLDLNEAYCSGHDEYIGNTNEAGKQKEFGYIDIALDGEDRTFQEGSDDMKQPEAVTRFYTDRVIAFFLVRENAENYLEYQKHNLRSPYIYTYHSGYRNWEMDNLLTGEG